MQRRDSDLLVEGARKIIRHWRERNQYLNHTIGLKEHINNFLFSHYRLTDKGNYVTFSKEPLPILFHALTIDIINKYFNGATKFYYKLADELRQSFMQRNTCYIEHYSALVILFALLNADRPEIYMKMIHSWPKVWGAVVNKIDIVDKLWSLKYERVLQKYIIAK